MVGVGVGAGGHVATGREAKHNVHSPTTRHTRLDQVGECAQEWQWGLRHDSWFTEVVCIWLS